MPPIMHRMKPRAKAMRQRYPRVPLCASAPLREPTPHHPNHKPLSYTPQRCHTARHVRPRALHLEKPRVSGQGGGVGVFLWTV